MIAVLKQQSEKLKQLLAPKIQIAKDRWVQLLPRERFFLMGLGAFLALSIIYMLIGSVVRYKQNLEHEVASLNQFSLYSIQSAQIYKQLSKADVNQLNQPTAEQIKSDIKQVLEIDNPNVLSQDGQISINVSNAPFSKVMTLLDQFRRSYGMYPDQINVIRQSQDGYVSVTAMFWVNQ